MNETQAWNCFARSGRVEDYLRYVQVRSIDHREEVLRGREAMRGKNIFYRHGTTDFLKILCFRKVGIVNALINRVYYTPILHGIQVICKG